MAYQLLLVYFCGLEGPEMNNTKSVQGLKQYIFTEIQTVIVTGNWLDSLDFLSSHSGPLQWRK